MTKIRHDQFQQKCGFQVFKEVSEGIVRDVVEIVAEPFMNTNPLGIVTCKLTKEQCVRGPCPIWRTQRQVWELNNRLKLFESVTQISIKVESLALKLDSAKPDDATRRELAGIRNEIRGLKESNAYEKQNEQRHDDE